MATLDDFPPWIREAAAKAHAAYADARVKDNLGVIIARALESAVERRDEEMKAALDDPNTVYLNLLRGTIAKPTLAQIAHIYCATLVPNEPTPRMVDEAAQRLVSFGEDGVWPDSWDPLQVAQARILAERAIRSAIAAAKEE